MPVFDMIPDLVCAEVLDCYAALDADAPDDYRQIASILMVLWRERGIRRVGLGAGQGAGKTTLSLLLEQASDHFGERTVVLGIDDFYLSKADRVVLGEDVHGLFATRGPAGTHDIGALVDAANGLIAGQSVSVPVFDKGIDEAAARAAINLGPFADWGRQEDRLPTLVGRLYRELRGELD